MKFLDYLFHGKELRYIDSYFKMLNGYSPTFTSYNGGVYEMDLTRTAVNSFATHCSKLKPEIEGSALKSLEKTLQHKPNYFMDTTKFIKRLATYVAVEHTAFIIPIEDEYGRLCGWYPLRAQRCEVVEAAGQVYLRYLFANGEHGAIEFERVGIMTDFEYTDDLFGEDNRTLKPTMQLIHTQNEGIINAVKNSANIRFLAKVANMLKPEDIKKERQRFTEDNLSADNDSGMIIYDNKFSELKQVESKPYTPNALQMQNIQENVCTHFGTNMDILQNKFDENTWNAYYEGKIEPFAIQLSLVMTNMSFTERERACGNAIFFSANRLQYASNATKLSVSTQLFDRALLNRNGVMDIWNMAHVEDGEKYYIRKEYTEVSELQNSNGKPQIIIQQAPIATGQQAEPQQTPPAAAAGSDKQKKNIAKDGMITFAYHKLRCAVAVSLEVDTMAISAFETLLINNIVEAMTKALEQAIIDGNGTGKPKGILAETPADGQTIESAAPSYSDLIKAEGALPMAYENGAVWCMSKKTFMEYVGMTDKNGQPRLLVQVPYHKKH